MTACVVWCKSGGPGYHHPGREVWRGSIVNLPRLNEHICWSANRDLDDVAHQVLYVGHDLLTGEVYIEVPYIEEKP